MPWWRIRKRKGHEKDKLFEETGEVSKRVKNKGKEKEKKKKKGPRRAQKAYPARLSANWKD